MSEVIINVKTPGRVIIVKNKTVRTPVRYTVSEEKLKSTTDYLNKMFIEYDILSSEDNPVQKNVVHKPGSKIDNNVSNAKIEKVPTGNLLNDILLDDFEFSIDNNEDIVADSQDNKDSDDI